MALQRHAQIISAALAALAFVTTPALAAAAVAEEGGGSSLRGLVVRDDGAASPAPQDHIPLEGDGVSPAPRGLRLQDVPPPDDEAAPVAGQAGPRVARRLQGFIDPKSVELKDSPYTADMMSPPLVATSDSQQQLADASALNTVIEERPDPEMKKKYNDRFGVNKDACMQYTCDWNTERCATASEDYYSPDATDPPCCVDILRQINRAFDREMNELGLDYTVMRGTLLGLIRDGDLIPWTGDNDYLVPAHVLKQITERWDDARSGLSLTHIWNYRLCVNENFMDGKLLKWKGDDKWKSKNIFSRKIPYADLYSGYGYEGNATHAVTPGAPFYALESGCCAPVADIWPSSRATFGEYELNVPANAEHILASVYGPEWRVPDASHSPRGTTVGCGGLSCPDLFVRKVVWGY